MRTYPRGVPCWIDTEQPDRDAACRFYGALFGWEADELDLGDGEGTTMWRRPGYGDHLAATVDPGIHVRQAAISAPPGFRRHGRVAWHRWKATKSRTGT